MNDFTYCYWLQGFFELTKPVFLTKHQVYLVHEHLKLVEKKEGIFCNWLQGVFDFCGINEWNEEMTSKIKAKLREEFFKIIDRSYPEEQQDILYKIHQGELNKSNFQ